MSATFLSVPPCIESIQLLIHLPCVESTANPLMYGLYRAVDIEPGSVMMTNKIYII